MKILAAFRTPTAVVVLSTRSHDQARRRVSELFGPAMGLWVSVPFPGLGNRDLAKAMAEEIGPTSLLMDGQLGPVAVARLPQQSEAPDLPRVARSAALRLHRERKMRAAAAQSEGVKDAARSFAFGRLRIGFAR
ncbi:MAG: hypothetical protein AAF321_07985 [Pseudomonadota bacterium]